jgi:hypothetical protein
MPTLNRKQMEQAIAEGGSVLYEGQVITRAEDLPTEAALAKGDPAKEQAAAADLQARISAMEAELATLRKEQPSEPAPVTGDEDGKPNPKDAK